MRLTGSSHTTVTQGRSVSTASSDSGRSTRSMVGVAALTPQWCPARVTSLDRMARVGTSRVWMALGIVYVVWGSTYLAIRIGVAPTGGTGLPPLLLSGVRFTLAGGLMLALFARRPAPDRRPDPLGPRQWAASGFVGAALLLGGNGLVSI